MKVRSSSARNSGWQISVLALAIASSSQLMAAEPATEYVEVVGQAVNGRDAVTMARHLRPDVCLFDIRMPELDGIFVQAVLQPELCSFSQFLPEDARARAIWMREWKDDIQRCPRRSSATARSAGSRRAGWWS